MSEGLTPLLEVRDLAVRFPVRGGTLHALSGVGFELDRGQILALVGESGSGKSTVARVLARLVAPSAGQVRLDGRDVLADEPRSASMAYRKRVQLVFQDPFGSLNPVHPVVHHVERPLLLHGRASRADVRQKALELLDQVGLAPAADYADQRPYELSGGQRQRVAIARALAPDPDVLIADEPTSMLDVSIRMDILRLFDRLRRQRDLAVLLITHDLAAARFLADRVMVLYAGQVMEELPSRALAEARHPYTRLLVAAAPRPGADLRAGLPARPGLPPTVDPPPGCRFAERCPEAVGACRTGATPIASIGAGHRIRCPVQVERGDEA
jgi:peptide/nickel transport system ATP-binding protein